MKKAVRAAWVRRFSWTRREGTPGVDYRCGNSDCNMCDQSLPTRGEWGKGAGLELGSYMVFTSQRKARGGESETTMCAEMFERFTGLVIDHDKPVRVQFSAKVVG